MQHDAIRVGLIEDDPIMGESIVQRLRLEGWSVEWWKSGGEALSAAGFAASDVVVCDIRLPDMSGEDVFRSKLQVAQVPPFVFITGYGEIDQAVRLMRLGASDYILKPFEFEKFLTSLRHNAIGRGQCERPLSGSLGVSPQSRDAEAILARYADSDLPVLIVGETGVGKEVAAKLIHANSKLEPGPFIAVNCAAIPAELLESEIFGHERGAFSGAQRQHLGYAERAKGGTLFLDEIGDMPLALQAKILRLVEERCFHRVGGERALPFEGRIIAATHRNLATACKADFREDLFYRLSVLPLELQPLRNRPEDIPWLMRLFFDESCRRQQSDYRGFSSLAEELALDHDWPGNARELRNRIERAVAVGTGEWIMPQDLFPDRAARHHPTGAFSPLADVRDAAERRQIERALEVSEGHVIAAARLLDISRTTLWEKMTRLGIQSRRSDS